MGLGGPVNSKTAPCHQNGERGTDIWEKANVLPRSRGQVLKCFVRRTGSRLGAVRRKLVGLRTAVNSSRVVGRIFQTTRSIGNKTTVLKLGDVRHATRHVRSFFGIVGRSPIRASHRVRSLLLRVFSKLRRRLRRLRDPCNLASSRTRNVVAALRPVFSRTRHRLGALTNSTPITTTPPPDVTQPTTATATSTTPADRPRGDTIRLIFHDSVPRLLQRVLTAFGRTSSGASHRRLTRVYRQLRDFNRRLRLPQ